MWKGECCICEKKLMKRDRFIRFEDVKKPACYECRKAWERETIKIYLKIFKRRTWENKIKWEQKEKTEAQKDLERRLKEYPKTKTSWFLDLSRVLYSLISIDYGRLFEEEVYVRRVLEQNVGWKEDIRNKPTRFIGLWKGC